MNYEPARERPQSWRRANGVLVEPDWSVSPLDPNDSHRRREDDRPGERGVSFTVKELFLDVKEELQRLTGKVEFDLRSVNTQLNTLERNGTQQARDALAEVHSLDRRVVELEKTSATREAVEKNQAYIRALAFTFLLALGGWIVSFLVKH